jgi:hypothetical protein
MNGPLNDVKDVESWDAQQLYDQYHLREKLIGEMVGWLYPRILSNEMEMIEAQAIERFGYHPNWFPEKGLAECPAPSNDSPSAD